MTWNNKAPAHDLPIEGDEPFTDPRVAGQMLKYWRMKRSLTQKEVVERTSLPNIPYLSTLESGRYHPGNSEHFQSLATALDLPVEEIKRFNPRLVVQAGPQSNETASGAPEFVPMPVFNLASALQPTPIPDLKIPVHVRDLRPGTRLLRVEGDGMTSAPGQGILPGDVIAIDERDHRIADGRVYVVEVIGGGFVVKRARKLGDDIWLFSDNPDQSAHPPLKPDQVNVKGRVYRVYRIPDVKL